MSNTIQDFLASATAKAAADLTTAFLRIPEEKRRWSPDEKARTALDQFVECALLSGYTSETIKTRQMDDGSMANYTRDKAEAMSQDWEHLNARFQENTAKVIAAIRAVSEDELGAEVSMPWGPMTVAQIIAYPHWNMTYHEGQINYIASILGCLP